MESFLIICYYIKSFVLNRKADTSVQTHTYIDVPMHKQANIHFLCLWKQRKILKSTKDDVEGILRPAVIKLTLKIWKYNLNFPSHTVSTFPDFQSDFECSSRNILTVHYTMFPIYQIAIIAFQRFYRIGLFSLLDYSLIICLLLDVCNSKNPCQKSTRFIWLLRYFEKKLIN